MPPMFLGLLLIATADVAQKPGVAAMDITAKEGVRESVASLLSDAILSRLKESGHFGSVLGSSDIEAMLDLEQQKAALACDENSCLADLGGALGVPYLLTTTLGGVGGKIMLNIKLIAVDDAKVVNRLTRVFADEGDLLAKLNDSVDALLTGAFSGGAPSIPETVSLASPVKPKPTVSAKQAAVMKASTWRRIAGGLAVVGTGLFGYSYLHVQEPFQVFTADQSPANFDVMAAARREGILMQSLGTVAVLGAGLTWWSAR